MIYCCQEDYDMAIDDFILEHETFPVMNLDGDHKCHSYDEASAYVMTIESSEGIKLSLKTK